MPDSAWIVVKLPTHRPRSKLLAGFGLRSSRQLAATAWAVAWAAADPGASKASAAASPGSASALSRRIDVPARRASRLVDRIDPAHRLGLLDRVDLEIDHHRLVVAAHQHAFERL